MYRPDLLNDIYEDYMNIFNKLIIKPYIYDKIEQFYNKHFNEHTISVHLRSWTNCNERKHFFDINKFINIPFKFLISILLIFSAGFLLISSKVLSKNFVYS